MAPGKPRSWVYGKACANPERINPFSPCLNLAREIADSEVPKTLGLIARREGNWNESIAYLEQALALDPRNMELLMPAADTYTWLRKFPAALKFYDRGLDITPNDPDIIAAKADIYQAQGNLQEAAKLLSEINAQTSNEGIFRIKMTQLRLERNLGEAIRLLQARQTHFHFASDTDEAVNQLMLAWTQRLAGDTAGAKASGEQAQQAGANQQKPTR